MFDAALEAGATRFRPIMLTALSTVFGMIPIAPTVFWGPMAFAIMGGLLAGTLLDPRVPARALCRGLWCGHGARAGLWPQPSTDLMGRG